MNTSSQSPLPPTLDLSETGVFIFSTSEPDLREESSTLRECKLLAPFALPFLRCLLCVFLPNKMDEEQFLIRTRNTKLYESEGLIGSGDQWKEIILVLVKVNQLEIAGHLKEDRQTSLSRVSFLFLRSPACQLRT